MSDESIEKIPTVEQMKLMRDIATLVQAFSQKHPNIDPVEIVAVIGAVAGACISSGPDPIERERARLSVINSMNAAIADFLQERTFDA